MSIAKNVYKFKKENKLTCLFKRIANVTLIIISRYNVKKESSK